MGGMGCINRHHIAVMGLQPGPDLIHPAQRLNMRLPRQCRLLAGGGVPGGLSSGSHENSSRSPRPITSSLLRQSQRLFNALLPDQTETRGQGIAHQALHGHQLQPRNPVAKPTNRPTFKTTGHNGPEALQIAVHVHSQAVLGDPAATTDTDRRHLVVLEPDTGESLDPLPPEAEQLQHVDHDPFQLTQVPMQIGATTTQIQHRVNHQLTRRVMGHFPAAVNAVQRCRGMLRIEEEMGFTGAAAKGVTTRVLQQPDRLGIGVCGRFIEQSILPTTLQIPGLLEGNQLGRLKKKCRRPASGIQRRH